MEQAKELEWQLSTKLLDMGIIPSWIESPDDIKMRKETLAELERQGRGIVEHYFEDSARPIVEYIPPERGVQCTG